MKLLQNVKLMWALVAALLCAVVALVVTRPTPAQKPTPAAPVAVAKPAAMPPLAPVQGGEEWKVVRTTLQHSIARTFDEAVPEDGDALAAVFTRLFVWDLDVRRDLHPGDELAVAYRWNEDNQIEIAVARLHAKKAGKLLRGYRFQQTGDAFASYWQESGTEVPLRLKGGPLDQYDQITSLLKDRPTHKGMDFKTPVGTPVSSPQVGTVTRANWNWNANGNCIEVQYADGTLAKFLHLSENRVKPGDAVRAGQVIALTGNTGRSTAPHLHYQLDQGSKVLDPLDYHGTERRALLASDGPAFEAAKKRMDALIAPQTAEL